MNPGRQRCLPSETFFNCEPARSGDFAQLVCGFAICSWGTTFKRNSLFAGERRKTGTDLPESNTALPVTNCRTPAMAGASDFGERLVWAHLKLALAAAEKYRPFCRS